MSDQRHRSMMCVHDVVDTPMGVMLEVSISGWRPHRRVWLTKEMLPEDILEEVEHSPGPGECTMYLHCKMLLDAATSNELDPAGPWTLERVVMHPDPDAPLGMSVERLSKSEWDEDGKYIPF